MTLQIDIAKEYEDISDTQKEHGLAFISDISIQKGDKILDIGCGTGYLSKVMANIVGAEGHVLAIDTDVDRLRVAKSLNGASNLEYISSSCEDSFPGRGYDIVFSNYVFHWIQHMDVVFNNAYESLTADGMFAFLMPAPYDLIGTYFSPPTMMSEEFQSHILSIFQFRESSELKQLALQNNFEILSFVRENTHMTFESVDGLIQMLRVGGYKGKWFDNSHFNRTAMKKHFGVGSVVINYPIFKVILIKKRLNL